MNFYANDTYGERVAGVYDDWYSAFDPDAIDLLEELSAKGRALELGIGTGRIALPLSARGIAVSGIDAAASMVSRLKAKPGAEKVTVAMGDFSEVPITGTFDLVYVVFNTFFALSTQQEQVNCFRNVAAHLTSGGCFLIEAFFPDPSRFSSGKATWATAVTSDRVELDVSNHDAVTQKVVSQKVVMTDGQIRLYPVQIRYVWPSEMDLMAQLAGLRLRSRWGNWQRSPFTGESQKHISVYEKQ
jgi:SAM-dependent methyltransferase